VQHATQENTASGRTLLRRPERLTAPALLSCVGFGWYEGRAMRQRKGERLRSQVDKEVLGGVVEDAEVAW
jgi:hypothetical protein